MTDNSNKLGEVLSYLEKMVEEKNNGANIVVLGFKEQKSNSYGKLIQSQTGYLQKIVEHKDANSQEQKHTLCNQAYYLEKEIEFLCFFAI